MMSQGDIFPNFFAPFPTFGDDIGSSSSPFGSDPFGAGADRHTRGQRRAAKASAMEWKLPCSLEELYGGTTKKMKISRDIIDASGRTILVEEILTINVKPGWKKGIKITFTEKGNEVPNVIPADLIFIIDEKPHHLFTRDLELCPSGRAAVCGCGCGCECEMQVSVSADCRRGSHSATCPVAEPGI